MSQESASQSQTQGKCAQDQQTVNSKTNQMLVYYLKNANKIFSEYKKQFDQQHAKKNLFVRAQNFSSSGQAKVNTSVNTSSTNIQTKPLTTQDKIVKRSTAQNSSVKKETVASPIISKSNFTGGIGSCGKEKNGQNTFFNQDMVKMIQSSYNKTQSQFKEKKRNNLPHASQKLSQSEIISPDKNQLQQRVQSGNQHSSGMSSYQHSNTSFTNIQPLQQQSDVQRSQTGHFQEINFNLNNRRLLIENIKKMIDVQIQGNLQRQEALKRENNRASNQAYSHQRTTSNYSHQNRSQEQQNLIYSVQQSKTTINQPYSSNQDISSNQQYQNRAQSVNSATKSLSKNQQRRYIESGEQSLERKTIFQNLYGIKGGLIIENVFEKEGARQMDDSREVLIQQQQKDDSKIKVLDEKIQTGYFTQLRDYQRSSGSQKIRLDAPYSQKQEKSKFQSYIKQRDQLIERQAYLINQSLERKMINHISNSFKSKQAKASKNHNYSQQDQPPKYSNLKHLLNEDLSQTQVNFRSKVPFYGINQSSSKETTAVSLNKSHQTLNNVNTAASSSVLNKTNYLAVDCKSSATDRGFHH